MKLIATVVGVCACALAQGSVELVLRDLNVETVEALRKGDLDGVLTLEKGSDIPFMVSLQGDVVSLADASSSVFNVQASSDLFVKFQKGEVLFSSDREEWRSFESYFKGMMDVQYGEGEAGSVKLSLSQFKKKAKDKVFELKEGSVVPLTLSLKGGLLSFDKGAPSIQVSVEKKLFVKKMKNGFLVSREGKQWATPAEFFKGMIGVTFGHEETGLLGEKVIK